MSYKKGNGNKNENISSNQSSDLAPDDDLDSSFIIGDDGSVKDLLDFTNVSEEPNNKEEKDVFNKKTLKSLQKFHDLVKCLSDKFIESCKGGDEFFIYVRKQNKKIVPVFIDYREFWDALSQQDNKKIFEAKMKIILRAAKQCYIARQLNKHDFKPFKRLIYVLLQSGLSLCLNESIEKIQKEIISNIGEKLYERLLPYAEDLYCFPPEKKYLVIKNEKIMSCKQAFSNSKPLNIKNKDNILIFLKTDIRTLLPRGGFALVYDLCYMVYLFYTDSGYIDNLVRSELKLKLVQLNLFQSIKYLRSKQMTIYQLDKKFFIMSLNNLISACKEIFLYGEGCFKNPTERNWGSDWEYVFDDIMKLSIICAYLFAHLRSENQNYAVNQFNKLLSILSKLMKHNFFMSYAMEKYDEKYSIIEDLYNIRMGQRKYNAEAKYKGLVVCIKSLPLFLGCNEDNWDIIEENQTSKNNLSFTVKEEKIISYWFKSKEVKGFVDYFAREAVHFCMNKRFDSSFLDNTTLDKLSKLFEIACKYYNFLRSEEKYSIVIPLSKIKKSNNLPDTKIKSLYLYRGKNQDIDPLNRRGIKLVSLGKMRDKQSSGNCNQPPLEKLFNFSKSGKYAAQLLSQPISNHMRKLVKKQLEMIKKIGHTFISYNDFWSGLHLHNIALEIEKVISVINSVRNSDFKLLLKSAYYLELQRLTHINFLKKVGGIVLTKYEYLYKLIFSEAFQVDKFEEVADGFCLISRLRVLNSKEVFKQFQSIEQEIFRSKTRDTISQVIALWQIFHLFCTDNNYVLRVKALTKISSLQMDKSFNLYCAIRKKNSNNDKKIKKKYILNPKESGVLALIEACDIAQCKNAKRVFKQIMIFCYSLRQVKHEYDLEKLRDRANKIFGSKIVKVGKEDLNLNLAFAENELDQQIKFLIFCFQGGRELTERELKEKRLKEERLKANKSTRRGSKDKELKEIKSKEKKLKTNKLTDKELKRQELEEQELLDLLYTYKFPGCQFAQLFLRSTINVCVKYFCNLKIKEFLFDDNQICCQAFKVFKLAVILYCVKDVDANAFCLQVAQDAVRKVKESLQNKINGLIKKICLQVKEKLEKGVLKKLKASGQKEISWSEVRDELIKTCMSIVKRFLGDDDYRKYFPDLKEQLNCIIREIRKISGVPSSEKTNNKLYDLSQDFKKIFKKFVQKKEKGQQNNVEGLLTGEQRKKVERNIKQFFCESLEPSKRLSRKSKRNRRKSFWRRSRKVCTIVKQARGTRVPNFGSYITERLNKCNFIGPLYHFIINCRADNVKFNESFNTTMLNSGQPKFSHISTEKYSKTDCKEVLRARYMAEESRLHGYVAGFSHTLFLAGKLFPKLKFFGVLYQIQSWSIFSFTFGGITLRGENTYPCIDSVLSFSLFDLFKKVKENFLSEDIQKKTKDFIKNNLNSIGKVGDSNNSDKANQVKIVVELLKQVGLMNSKVACDPRFNILPVFTENKNGRAYLTSHQVFEMLLFSLTQSKVNLKGEKNKISIGSNRYQHLHEFFKNVMYGAKSMGGALRSLEVLLRNKGCGEVADALQELVKFESTCKMMHTVECIVPKAQCLQTKIIGYAYSSEIMKAYTCYRINDYRGVLYHLFENIVMKASNKMKLLPAFRKFLPNLVLGICAFIEHKNFMGMCLRDKLRKVIDELFVYLVKNGSKNTKKYEEIYNKLCLQLSKQEADDLRDDIDKLKHAPENSSKLSANGKHDYLRNMQELLLNFNEYAAKFMMRVFADLIKIDLRKLYLKLILQKLNGAKYKINFNEHISLLESEFKNNQENFIQEVEKYIKNIQQSIRKHNALVRINEYLVCLKQNWFWSAAEKIFRNSQKRNNNNFYKCIFCIVVFLQDERLNGFSKKAPHSKRVDIFKEGFKRICSLLVKRKLEHLKPYLHFILTKKLSKKYESNVCKKGRFAVWLDFYQEMAANCKGMFTLLVYREFFKVFFSFITCEQFKEFRPKLFEIYNLISKKVNLPVIEERFSLVRIIGLIKSVLLIFEYRKNDPCCQIMYHECLKFVEERQLLKNMKHQVSKRGWSQANAWSIEYVSGKCKIRVDSEFYNYLLNSFFGKDCESSIKIFYLDGFLAAKMLGFIDFNKQLVKRMGNNKRPEQKPYISDYLDEYFEFLCDIKHDQTFDKIKKMQWYQLETYVKHIKDTTNSYNQQHFFKKIKQKDDFVYIVDDKFKLQARVKWRLYRWFDFEADKYFGKSINKIKIKKAVLRRVNKLVAKITDILLDQAKYQGVSISDDAIKRMVMKNVKSAHTKYVQKCKDLSFHKKEGENNLKIGGKYTPEKYNSIIKKKNSGKNKNSNQNCINWQKKEKQKKTKDGKFNYMNI